METIPTVDGQSEGAPSIASPVLITKSCRVVSGSISALLAARPAVSPCYCRSVWGCTSALHTHTHDSNPDADADAHKFDGLPGKESDLRFDGGVGGRPNPDAAIWTISLSDKGTRPHPHQMT
jgi:hypothetical protein